MLGCNPSKLFSLSPFFGLLFFDISVLMGHIYLNCQSHSSKFLLFLHNNCVVYLKQSLEVEQKGMLCSEASLLPSSTFPIRIGIKVINDLSFQILHFVYRNTDNLTLGKLINLEIFHSKIKFAPLFMSLERCNEERL